MRATSERMGKEPKSSSLEAEAAAWCSKRGRRPLSLSGKVQVVHIRRRAGASSSLDRPLAAASR